MVKFDLSFEPISISLPTILENQVAMSVTELIRAQLSRAPLY